VLISQTHTRGGKNDLPINGFEKNKYFAKIV
jgi:hypothetical protein